jgi:hypothetical protein
VKKYESFSFVTGEKQANHFLSAHSDSIAKFVGVEDRRRNAAIVEDRFEIHPETLPQNRALPTRRS